MAEAVSRRHAQARRLNRSTIAALASGRPPAAIAIVRISGPDAFAALTSLTGRVPPPERQMALRSLTDPQSGGVLDTAIVVGFRGPATASGEDLVELHLHGGAAVVTGVLEALVALAGIRIAEPGEFTRRAFANGRLDLTQVEGLADLIAADTAAQRQQALALAGGSLSRAADQWRLRCLDLLAEAEAGLDFAEDEADVASRIDEAAQHALLSLVAELRALLDDSRRGERLRNGLTIAVSGPPNCGKSSLVNALSRTEASIVTAIPGTTRDPIEVPLDLGGIAAVLIDTAGLRETDDLIEAEGIRRARARAATADLVLHVVDALPEQLPPAGILVVNKIDLHGAKPGQGGFGVSALHGDGLPELRAALANWAAGVVRPGEPALLSHVRHRSAFSDAASALSDAAASHDPVLKAEALRHAARAFASIAGRVDVDDVLDRIFSRFCIGK